MKPATSIWSPACDSRPRARSSNASVNHARNSGRIMQTREQRECQFPESQFGPVRRGARRKTVAPGEQMGVVPQARCARRRTVKRLFNRGLRGLRVVKRCLWRNARIRLVVFLQVTAISEVYA